MSLESALIYLLAIFVFAITPGPGIFALMARGMTRGARSCLPLALGMTVSDILYLLLACYGLAALAENWGEAFTVIRYLGAAYLLYLGWKLWNAPLAAASPVDPEQRRGECLKGFLQGFLISASNPKVILFYIAFLPSFIDLTVLTPPDMLLAVALTFAGLMTGLMLVSTGVAGARHLLKTERGAKGANRSAGALMMTAGAFLMAKG